MLDSTPDSTASSPHDGDSAAKANGRRRNGRKMSASIVERHSRRERIKQRLSVLQAEDLIAALDGLLPRHRDIVKRRLGLEDGREQTLKEIAKHHSITPSRVRYIEQNALCYLDHNRRMPRLAASAG